MSTSDGGSGADASAVAPNDLATAMAKEIERLANQYFAGVPGPALNAPIPPTPSIATITSPGALVPPHVGPNAIHVGSGGASPAVTLPPVPGPVHRPPLAATPPPKESDFRAIPTLLSEQLGLSSPIALAGTPDASTPAPYFLELAGLPGSAPMQSAPAAPASSGLGGTPGPSAAPAQEQLPSFPLHAGDTARFPAIPAPSPNAPFPSAPQGVPSHAAGFSHAPHTPSLPGAYGIPSDVAGYTAPPAPHATPSSTPGIVHPGTTASGIATPAVPDPAQADRKDRPRGRAEPAIADRGIEDAADAPSTSDARAYDFRPEVVPDLDVKKGIFDPYAIKRDFPILDERVHGRRLVWLDNAATTQKPQAVIDRLTYYYEHENSNIHRAAHTLAARATDAYEAARDKVRRFLNAPTPREIIFVRGATEGINLLAQSWGRRNVGPGDEIVISWLEHHANIVPWQLLCAEKGARLRVAPVDSRGQVILDEYEKLLGPRTRLVSFTQVSNALGTITPARAMIEMAHRHGAVVHLDGAQAVSHMPVDVQALDCDFYTFSGHKVFAPTGIGVVFGKTALLEQMPPWQGGGNMIADVTFEKTTYQPPPGRFEAGTGNIADAVGLGAALDYVSALGLENISRYEHELLVYGEQQLARVPGLRMIGTAPEKAGVLSFVLDGVRTEDVGGMLDQEGIAVRSGHHCAQPILRRFGLEATVRASLAPYNTPEDIDALVAALLRLQSGRPPRGL